ncbi:hypothetical protein JXB11_01800 [Candidatus Woesearchaeota archaeon]|nr:hypothetical protein [Candidatus Woesearchaeota archaeon]
MKKGSSLLSIIIIAGGIILLLITLGLLDFSNARNFADYWPAGVILIGVALILRMKVVALFILFITCIIGGIYLVNTIGIYEGGEQRVVIQQITAREDITSIDLKVDYGAGRLVIDEGSEDYLIRNTIETADEDDPEVDLKKEGSLANIHVKRQGSFSFVEDREESWDLEVSPAVEADIELNYGAADAEIDISGLKVGELDVNAGATSTKIRFGTYPTEASIDVGASSIELKFPEGSGVRIRISEGITSTYFPGFTKEGEAYVSKNYDADGENIEIEINAGASSIDSEFY